MYKLPEELLHRKFRFVTLASKRAEQLQQGSMPKVDATGKTTVTAQKEVALGFVDQWDPEQEPLLAPGEEEE